MILAAAHPVVVRVVPHVVVHSDDIAATVLGALGVVLALAALGWQAYTFLRSGSRVKATLRTGATDGASYATSVGKMTDSQTQLLLKQGLTIPIIGIEVVNSGRGPTSVTSADLLYTNGMTYGGQYLTGTPKLPHRLDGETEETWYLDAHQVHALAKAWEKTTPTGKAYEIRARVRVAGRTKPILSKNKIRVL